MYTSEDILFRTSFFGTNNSEPASLGDIRGTPSLPLDNCGEASLPFGENCEEILPTVGDSCGEASPPFGENCGIFLSADKGELPWEIFISLGDNVL